MEGPTFLRAGLAVLSADEIQRSVSIEIQGGKIVGWQHIDEEALTSDERATILAPGLVNAHVHLDLGALRQRVPATGGFTEWVARLVAARAELSPEEIAEGVRASAREALRTGTTTLIDIDSTGVTASALAQGLDGIPVPRAVILKEVLDGSPAGRSARTEAAVEEARLAIERGQGLSPHGSHTVGDALMADLGRLRVAAAPPVSIPVSTHWAETREETDWLLRGEGPFASWLGPSPMVSGTERLERAGLLEHSILIHGNDPQPGEAARLSSRGCTLVHCPGSHLFFGRDPFPLETYQRHGVNLALGTDSWASNLALDMRREMRLARETLGLGARDVWRMATENGALCLHDSAVTGRIEVGSAADLVAYVHPARNETIDLARMEATCLDVLTLHEPEIRGVWVEGHAWSGD